ncbi:hypothetical protein G3N58_15080 [Paraburkholderia sp. Ac-20342]|uniref:hypothetical protein n=1 Tax=Paraburkholderia sp. Ac-20342 TaxID=2703889 RepID=UPI00197E80B7|nr:hypothetical protein [Paraburkholderia sp. Ac-20342]MBN3848143.1 hypothetical protein [Paraburkholderia sp. Ac-20342]
MVAAAVGIGAAVGGIGSAVIGGNASKSAANTQADAATQAAQLQEQQYDQTRSDLEPYRELGSNAINPLLQALGYTSSMPAAPSQAVFAAAAKGDTSAQAQISNWYQAYNATPMNSDGTPAWRVDPNNPLQQKFSYAAFTAPTAAQAAATPGYQFTLDQGLKASQNSASARGLGASGAAIKGAETFATGLADSTYGDTFNRALAGYTANRNNALGNFTTNYGVAADNANRLLGLVNTGENAATQTGVLGAQSANSIGNSLTSGAAAQAAGTVGAANAATGGISTAVNGGTNALLLNSLLGKSSGTSGSTLYGNSYSGFDNPSNYG